MQIPMAFHILDYSIYVLYMITGGYLRQMGNVFQDKTSCPHYSKKDKMLPEPPWKVSLLFSPKNQTFYQPILEFAFLKILSP